MRIVCGPADGPVALLLPGTASTSDFIARAFGPALGAAGFAVASADSTAADEDTLLGELDAAAVRLRPALVGGVSRGAHLAVRWAGRPGSYRPAGMLLAMPAWTGPPGPIAAASAAAANEIDTVGTEAALAAIRERAAAHPDAAWVLHELELAWPANPALAATLRATAASAGPSAAELTAVGVPCGVLGLRDDALHPADVARQWAAALPQAALVETTLAAVGADRGTLGRGALLAWLRARTGGALSRSR